MPSGFFVVCRTLGYAFSSVCPTGQCRLHQPCRGNAAHRGTEKGVERRKKARHELLRPLTTAMSAAYWKLAGEKAGRGYLLKTEKRVDPALHRLPRGIGIFKLKSQERLVDPAKVRGNGEHGRFGQGECQTRFSWFQRRAGQMDRHASAADFPARTSHACASALDADFHHQGDAHVPAQLLQQQSAGCARGARNCGTIQWQIEKSVDAV